MLYSGETPFFFLSLSLHGLCANQHQQLFRLWLGVTEYLFRNPSLLDEVLDIAIDDHTFRSDDLEFTFAARVSLPLSSPPSLNSSPGEFLND